MIFLFSFTAISLIFLIPIALREYNDFKWHRQNEKRIIAKLGPYRYKNILKNHERKMDLFELKLFNKCAILLIFVGFFSMLFTKFSPFGLETFFYLLILSAIVFNFAYIVRAYIYYKGLLKRLNSKSEKQKN